MMIAFLTSITVLPALLRILDPPGEPASIGYQFMAPVDRFLTDNRRAVLIGTAIMSVGALPLLAAVQFDFNPLHLRSSKVESVSTFVDHARDPETSPNTIDILRPSVEEASTLAARLEKLREVDKALTLLSFVPQDQDQKLPLIEDAATLLNPTLNPSEVKPPPSDGEIASAMDRAGHDLAAAANSTQGTGAEAARRLSRALIAIGGGSPDQRSRAAHSLLSGLGVVLDQIRAALTARPVTSADLPTDPTASTGGSSVVVNDTPTGLSDIPSLQAGTTYYWEVHGRSSTQFGNWSSIFNLFLTSRQTIYSLIMSI